MSYGRIVAGTWERNRLFSVLIELTYRCNLDCFFCYNDLSLRGVPLTPGQYDAFLEELVEMGVFELVLSGGEPLAHPAFFAVGSRAKALGFVVRVKSNGHALGGGLARRVKREVDPFVVEVSLHGACAETHDRQTRVAGSFERLLANITDMQAAGLRVRLNSTLTRWNEAETSAMYDLADARGLRLNFDTTVTPRDDGNLDPLSISASIEGVRGLLEIQARRAREGTRTPGDSAGLAPSTDVDLPKPETTKHCGAGSSALAVDPFGNVYPCVQWRVPVGNLHSSSVREIWESSAILPRLRELNVATKDSLGRNLGASASFAGFCPGLAVQHSGTPLAVYPGVAERARLAAEILGEDRQDPRETTDAR